VLKDKQIEEEKYGLILAKEFGGKYPALSSFSLHFAFIDLFHISCLINQSK